MMFRSAALLLLAAAPLAQGFGVVPMGTRSIATPVAPLFADKMNDNLEGKVFSDGPEEVDETVFAFDEAIKQQFEDEEEEVTPPVVTSIPMPSIGDEKKFNEAKDKATDALKAAATKAQDFANDERVQEIASKAGDFAKDIMGQVFNKVGDKLKEIKKEKEERAKQEQEM